MLKRGFFSSRIHCNTLVAFLEIYAEADLAFKVAWGAKVRPPAVLATPACPETSPILVWLDPPECFSIE